MNRSTNSRESLTERRNAAGGPLDHRRGRSLTRAPKDTDNNSNLFSRNCWTLSVPSSNESHDPPPKMEVGFVQSLPKVTDSGADDDLLLSGGGGKNDYDWLLSPPGTPLFCLPDGSKSQLTSADPRSNSLVISASTAKSSRLSVSHPEINHSSRPTRSSSLTRPSTSSKHYNSYSSSRTSSILNTSSSSVSSYIRPSSPTISRHSTPSPRRATSKPSCQPPTTTSNPKQRPFYTSSTRQTTPTRRNLGTSVPTNVPTNGRSPTPTSRPSYPGPRARPSKPLILPDFPQDTPPNLRTSLPERPLSVGRSRPGIAATAQGRDIESTTCGPSNSSRHSSPIISKGRLVEPIVINRHAHGHNNSLNLCASTRNKPIKASTTIKDVSSGFGRTISKKSLDVAIGHMGIRKSNGSIQPALCKTLFPKTNEPIISKSQRNEGYDTQDGNGNGSTNYVDPCKEDIGRGAKLSERDDVFESSRFDTILLKEDLISTNWLQCVDDRCDGPVFDYGFEPLPLPEPSGFFN